MVSLFEQIYTKTDRRLYYHGSPFYLDRIELRSRYRGEGNDGEYPTIFLSKSREFAGGYAIYASSKLPHPLPNSFPELRPTIHLCRITELKLDICNLSSDRDRERILESLPERKRDWAYDSLYGQSERHWIVMEDPDVLGLVSEAGYDGFATEEKGAENIALFHDCVRVIDHEVLEMEDGRCVGTDRDPDFRPEVLYKG
jgi:hypothetical protein